MSENRTSESVAVLIWLIVLTSILLALSACAMLPDPPPTSKAIGPLDHWLNRYQTISTGFLALAGGACVLVAAYWQISAEDRRAKRQEEEAFERIIEILDDPLRWVDIYFGFVLFSQQEVNEGKDFNLDRLTAFMPFQEPTTISFDEARGLEGRLSIGMQWRVKALISAVVDLKREANSLQNLRPIDLIERRLIELRRVARAAHQLDSRLGNIFARRNVDTTPSSYAKAIRDMHPDILDQRRT